MNSATSLDSFTPPASRGLTYRAWLGYSLTGLYLFGFLLHFALDPTALGPLFGIALLPSVLQFCLSAGLPQALVPTSFEPLAKLHQRHRRYAHLRRHLRNKPLFRRLMKELQSERVFVPPASISWGMESYVLGRTILMAGLFLQPLTVAYIGPPMGYVVFIMGFMLVHVLPRVCLPKEERWRAWAWDLGVVLEGHGQGSDK